MPPQLYSGKVTNTDQRPTALRSQQSNKSDDDENPLSRILSENWSAENRCTIYVAVWRPGAQSIVSRDDLDLPTSHFPGHVENKRAVAFFNLAQQAAKPVEIAGVLASTTPGDVVG